MKELMLLMLKKNIIKNKLKDEDIKLIINLLEPEMENYFDKQIKEIQTELNDKKNEIKNMKIDYDKMEIENQAILKRMEVLINSNKMLLAQLEQRDDTTKNTLNSIRDNIIISNEIFNELNNNKKVIKYLE